MFNYILFFLFATDLNHYLYLFLKAAYKILILKNFADRNDVIEATTRNCLSQRN